jgi:aerobic carbon-monoxide dehydrogenase medium subunit
VTTLFPAAYVRPRSLEELHALTLTPDTLAVAGGALLFGQFEPPYEQFIDLQAVENLRSILESDHWLLFGGAVMLSEMLASPLVDVTYKRALRRTLNPNLCNNASVGETLIARRPIEWLALLAAADARVSFTPESEIEAGYPSVRDLEQLDLRKTVITNITAPRRGLLGSAFVARTPADLPIVCTAVSVSLNADGTIASADAALGGVSADLHFVERLTELEGSDWRTVDFSRAAAAVRDHVSPVGDVFGSADYRREMAAVLTRRALEDARERWIANAAAS